MRLIDADALIEVLEKRITDCEEGHSKTQGTAWEYLIQAYKRAIGEVKNQQTIKTTNQ